MLLLVVLFVTVVLAVIAITKGQRRIPTQSAKHVRGRRVYGGTRQFLPLKVNQAGVMPVIFASSLLIIPGFLFRMMYQSFQVDWAGSLGDALQRGSGWLYNVLYIALIYFFCYFWTAITFNPKDMANNLKDYGSFIPGYRPGKSTSDYLEKVLMRITYVGRRVPRGHRDHSEPGLERAASAVSDRDFLRWNKPTDRGQRLPRFGAEDQ